MESRAKHYEHMENLMEAKAFQNREIRLFQRINHRTDGIHNAACQKHPQSMALFNGINAATASQPMPT